MLIRAPAPGLLRCRGGDLPGGVGDLRMGAGEGVLRLGGVRRNLRSSCRAGDRERRLSYGERSGRRGAFLAAPGAFFIRGSCDIEVTGAGFARSWLGCVGEAFSFLVAGSAIVSSVWIGSVTA